MKQVLQHVFWFVGLLLFQLLVLDNIHFLGVYIPMLYIYALIRLPSSLSTSAVILIGFTVGLIMDMFANTPGMHTAATTLMAGIRYPLIRLFILKEDFSNRTISLSWMGQSVFWRYTAIMVLVHHSAIFLLEAMSFMNGITLLTKIPVCSLLTILFIATFELINPKEHAR